MNVQDMETAVRRALPLTAVLWEDGGYGLIAAEQRAQTGRSTDLAIGNPGWARLAAAFDWPHRAVRRAAALEATLRALRDRPGPALLTLPVHYDADLATALGLGLGLGPDGPEKIEAGAEQPDRPRIHQTDATQQRRDIMNWDQVQGSWKEFKGRAREQWGELTDDELDQAAGERERLEGLLQRKYGKTKEEAREAVDTWLADA